MLFLPETFSLCQLSIIFSPISISKSSSSHSQILSLLPQNLRRFIHPKPHSLPSILHKPTHRSLNSESRSPSPAPTMGADDSPIAFTRPISPTSATLKNRHEKPNGVPNSGNVGDGGGETKTGDTGCGFLANASFMKWRAGDAVGLVRNHPMPCLFAAALLFFMGVEYTLGMIPATSPPFDLGFIVTRSLNRVLAASPTMNTLLAGLNTVFVAMQTSYILWTWVVEGRPRATISALYMFTCRGILGYSTQLPLPEDFLGSGADFPVGNVSFFLFYSGHVAASVIASLDMRRVHRWKLAHLFDALNFLQFVRLLSTRGHYTIDLVVGIGAGILFDHLAGKYVESKKAPAMVTVPNGGFFAPTKKP